MPSGGELIPQSTASIRVRQAFAHVFIIDLAGELTSSAQDALLHASEKAGNDGARVLILNFGQLAYKNPSGMKSLVTLLARCNAAGQRLFAVGLDKESRNIFEVTQLNEGITVYASEADALQAAHDLLDTPGAPLPVPASRVGPDQPKIHTRPPDSWAKP